MRTRTPITLLLAVLVTTWSPAWCCCVIAPLATGSTPCHADAPSSARDHATHGGCDHERASSRRHDDSTSPASGGPCHDPADGHCGCGTEFLSTTLPSVNLEFRLAFMHHDLDLVATTPQGLDLHANPDGFPPSARHDPGDTLRAQSLFARRCLLLI